MRSVLQLSLALTCLCLAWACTPSLTLYREGILVSPPGAGPATFTVLTYNAWHGLNTGEFWVTPAETVASSHARLKFQAALIKAAKPDVVLLQEVNPLPMRADLYVQTLAELGLEYDAIHQVDACGIRVREGKGLIPGLNNGLVILARRELALRKLQGLKLSGDAGRCDSLSGLQLEELRYALIGDITIPETGQHYLIASTHLHSGFEAGAHFLGQMERAHGAGFLARYPAFRWEIDQARLRRIGELDLLTRTLRQFRRDGVYAGFAMGGDFNFEPDFPEYQEAVLLRLTDAHVLDARDRELFTADPKQNRWIRIPEDLDLPVELQRVFRTLPPELQPKALEAYRSEAERPRRIDYLWLEHFFPDYCVRQRLFGTEVNEEGFPASDHFGVLTTFSRDEEACQTDSSTSR